MDIYRTLIRFGSITLFCKTRSFLHCRIDSDLVRTSMPRTTTDRVTLRSVRSNCPSSGWPWRASMMESSLRKLMW